jgi:hypothetical protein
VRADGGRTTVLGGPRAEDAPDGSEEPGEVDRLPLEELAHVDAGRRAEPAERDDGPDLGKRQSQAPALLDEREDARNLGRIDAIAGSRATCGWQDPSSLVEPYRFAAHSALPCNLADEQSASVHAHTLKLSPWGKVKTSRNAVPQRARAHSRRPSQAASTPKTSGTKTIGWKITSTPTFSIGITG